MINVAVIIVTYNGIKWIDKCISSLVSSSIALNIIVVDNGSTDETQNALKKYNIQFIQLSENSGFAKANNKGIKLAIEQNCDYVFLLNQDAWVERDTIEKLINIAVSNPEYGVLSPIHLNGSYTALDIKFANYLIPENCKNIISDLYMNKLKPVYSADFVNAAAWLIPVECIKKVGFFDPHFFFYGEDNNYLQRTKYHQYKIGIVPHCTICHDREIRQGKLNNIQTAKWERSQSLIMLLNVQKSISKSILFFLKEKIRLTGRYTYKKNYSLVGYQLKELMFCFMNLSKLKKIRSKYKNTDGIT